MRAERIFREGNHAWFAFGANHDRTDVVIDSNQYLVKTSSASCLIDPGGAAVFPSLLAGVTDYVPVHDITHVVFTHTEPHVLASLPMWRSILKPETAYYVPQIMMRHIGHIDPDLKLLPIPDEGMSLNLGDGVRLDLVPAHFLPSAGCYSVYDPRAGVLYSGLIGSGLPTADAWRDSSFVSDFDAYVKFMEEVQRRHFGSSRARDAWVERMSKLQLSILAPQHGLMMKGNIISRFMGWFGNVDVGKGIENNGRISGQQSAAA